jgi:hypothetical protein
MRHPRYSEKELEKLEKELEEAVKKEEGWVDASVYLGKEREVVSVYIGDKVPVRGHYRKINGKRVYIKSYLRRRRKK